MRLELDHGVRRLLFSAVVAAAAFATTAACKKPSDAAGSTTANARPAPPEPPAPAIVRRHVPLARASSGHAAHDGSLVVLAKHGARTVAYVADEDDTAIRAVDLDTKEELGTTSLSGRPAQMLVGKDGLLWVALRDEQAVQAFHADEDPKAPLDPGTRVETAIEPIALATTPDDATLLVVSAWGHALETFAFATKARTGAVDLAREPRAVTMSSDGKKAFVAHAASGHLSAVDLEARAVKPVDLGMSGWTERSRRAPVFLDFKLDGDGIGDDLDMPRFRCGTSMMRRVTFPPRVARQGFAVAMLTSAKGEDRVFAPHMAVATGDPLVTSGGYGGGGLETEDMPTELFDIDVVDAGKVARTTGAAARVGVDKRTGPEACRLPRAAVVDAARGSLFVSCLGVDKVIEYDATDATPTGAVKRRFEVPGGPAAIAIDPSASRAVVWASFDRALRVLSLDEAPDGKAAAKPTAKPTAKAANVLVKADASTRIALGAPRSPLSDEVALGRRLFHKAAEPRIARDGRACASCHPDGRDDGLVWSTPNGPRQTIFLAGRVGRGAPFGWLGEHGTLKEHITITMKNLKGAGVADGEYDAIVAYLGAMKPPPRARAVALGEREERGKELFHSSLLGCSSCHAEKTGYTDLDVHDVSSATEADVKRTFLAPSLRFIAGSAPYFHDGRYATLDELLEKNEKMGNTRSLSQDDRVALAAFLRTL